MPVVWDHLGNVGVMPKIVSALGQPEEEAVEMVPLFIRWVAGGETLKLVTQKTKEEMVFQKHMAQQ